MIRVGRGRVDWRREYLALSLRMLEAAKELRFRARSGDYCFSPDELQRLAGLLDAHQSAATPPSD